MMECYCECVDSIFKKEERMEMEDSRLRLQGIAGERLRLRHFVLFDSFHVSLHCY